jgi:predicted transposase YdaD
MFVFELCRTRVSENSGSPIEVQTNSVAMPKQITNIHDAFFKRALSDPSLASTFLREHLPPDLAGLLGPEAPEPVSGSFVDEALREHLSDLLFRIQLKGSRDGLAYILMEHKSSPDPGARLQLLRYVVRVLTQSYEQNNRQLPLPPVLPLLAHQGPQGWTISCEFADLFGTVPMALRAYLPSFRHVLVDLAPLEGSQLSGETRLRAFLKALKYRRRPDLNACIDIVLAEAPALEDEDLFVILTYLETGSTALSNKVVRETLERLVPERKERILGPLTQPYYEKGLAEGEAKILTLLLETRFGALPADFRQRISAADAGAIEAWATRAFEARDLQSVFE